MRGKVEIQGEEAGVGSGSAGLVCIRGSPRDVRRKGEKRSWHEGEDRREAEGEGGSFQGKWPRPPPRGGESGKRRQGIPPESGQWGLSGCREGRSGRRAERKGGAGEAAGRGKGARQ